MPVYLFTYHAYLSWLPDRPQGYVHHALGLQSANPDLARQYRSDAREEPVTFTRDIQNLLIEETQTAALLQRFEPRAIGTDPSHLHVLLQWRDEGRPWHKLRNGLKSSYTRRLNQSLGKRTWFSENASRKHVIDREHFDHLRHVYLPDHPGLKWDCDRGVYE